MIRKMCLIGLLLMTAVITGCLQPVDGTAPMVGEIAMQQDNEQVGTAYRLKALDPLYVRFSGIVDQQPALEVVIDDNGEISLLHINEPIMAAGLTASELENKIERLYIDGGIYKTVSVNITMTAKVFYVQGEVLAPGQFPLQSGTTLLQAIASARGYSPFAWKSKVSISRHGRVYKFNMKDLEKDPSKDVTIKAGDVIKVPQKPW